MEGGLDADRAFGATGNDFFKLDGDRRADYAFCGSGYDTVRADGNDIIANENGSAGVSDLATGTSPVFNCEKVIVDGVVVVFTPRQADRTTL